MEYCFDLSLQKQKRL